MVALDVPKPDIIMIVVTCTLASILVAVVLVLLVGLFDPVVDNGEILKIIGPAFQTVIGVFVGILSAKLIGTRKE